jgi:hypothetical protein
MADNASNDGKVIVTEGTAHVLKTQGATDICVDPATKAAAGFVNEVPSTRLAANKTTKTFINDKPIMTLPTEVGPPSESPHDPWVLSQNNGMQPYRMEAKATKGSTNVEAEGQPVIRTNDPTTQNCANTTGIVDGSNLDDDIVTEDEYLKSMCTLTKLTGVSAERALGKRNASAAREDYLEVLDSESVVLTSERQDMSMLSPGAIDPACARGEDHTTWSVQRTGGGMDVVEEEAVGKTFTVGSSFTNTPSIPWSTFMEVLRLLEFYSNPCIVRANALACANARTVDVRVFPGGALTLSMALPGGESSDTSISGMADALCSKANKVANFFGKVLGVADISFQLAVLEDFKLDATAEFKHCSRTLTTSNGDWRSPAHVGFAWSITLACSKFLYIGATGRISLIKFIVSLIPVARPVVPLVEWIEEKTGVGLFLEIIVDIAASLSVSIGIDEHEEITGNGAADACTIKPSFTLQIRLNVSVAELTAGLRTEGSLYIGIRAPTDPGYFLKAEFNWDARALFFAEGTKKGRFLWIGPRYALSRRKEWVLKDWKKDAVFRPRHFIERPRRR